MFGLNTAGVPFISEGLVALISSFFGAILAILVLQVAKKKTEKRQRLYCAYCRSILSENPDSAIAGPDFTLLSRTCRKCSNETLVKPRQ